MTDNDLAYPIDTSVNTFGGNFTSVITGTAHFPTGMPDGTMNANFKAGEGTQSRASFICRFEDHYTLAYFFLNCFTQVIGLYAISLGASHPLYSNHYCTEVDIVPVEPNITSTTWRYMQLNCTYQPASFDLGNPQPVREEALEVTGEFIQIPVSSPVYRSLGEESIGMYNGRTISGKATGKTETIFYPMMRYTVTLFQVQNLPLNTILPLMGTVNSNTFKIRLGTGQNGASFNGNLDLGHLQDPTLPVGNGNFYNVGGGYALYEGIGRTKRTLTQVGSTRFDIGHSWLISPIPHNMIPNESLITGSVTLIPTIGQTPDIFVMPDQPTYQVADHSVLGV